MPTRITATYIHQRKSDQLRDTLIAVSTVAFAVGVLILLTMIPTSKIGLEGITAHTEAQDFVGGP